MIDAVVRVGSAFPELEGRVVRLDLLDPRRRLSGLAYPAARPPAILLSPRELGTPRFDATVAHELTHLLQWPGRHLPQGERACDLCVLARFGERFVGPPAYLNVPDSTRMDWERWAPTAQRLALESLDARGAGMRNYLKFWESRFRAEVAAVGIGPAPGVPVPRPHALIPFRR